ncbi:hypothetical protein OAQ37_01355 [Alphaproteobacteria bacterium]|nr:hypothetical protein [Alphaproteobacteria bacterium]
MIESTKATATPRDALSSSHKLIPLENVVWRSPDMSFAGIDTLPCNRQYVADSGNPLDIIDLKEVVMNLSVVPSKVHWQNTNPSD